MGSGNARMFPEVSSRNGRVVSRVTRGTLITDATIVFDFRERGLDDQAIELGPEDIWQLREFRSDEIPEFVRVSPIGMLDTTILYGDYDIFGFKVNREFVQSPFTGRWDGDDRLYDLRHRELGTKHSISALWLRHLPGVLEGDTSRIRLTYEGSYQTIN